MTGSEEEGYERKRKTGRTAVCVEGGD